MATSLKSLFTDIADAIRSKTGKTEMIPALDFPNQIKSIPGGKIQEPGFIDYIYECFEFDRNTVYMYLMKENFADYPSMIVLPNIWDKSLCCAGTMTLIRDEESFYKVYYNGIEQRSLGFCNFEEDDYFYVEVNYERPSLLTYEDYYERDAAMYWM